MAARSLSNVVPIPLLSLDKLGINFSPYRFRKMLKDSFDVLLKRMAI